MSGDELKAYYNNKVSSRSVVHILCRVVTGLSWSRMYKSTWIGLTTLKTKDRMSSESPASDRKVLYT